MKVNLKIVIIIVLEITLLSLFVLNKYDKKEEVNKINVTDAKEEQILEYKKELTVTSAMSINELSSTYLSKIIKIEDRYAYMLDYPSKILNEDDILKRSEKKVSDKIATALLAGFPNNSFSNLGLKDEKEAYIATQLAIWELSYKNGDGKGTERSYIVSMKESVGFSNLNIRIFEAAQKIVEEAENDTYSSSDVIDFAYSEDGKVGFKSNEEGENFIGPITVNIKDFNVTDVDIYVTDSNDEKVRSEVLDKYGNTLFHPVIDDNEIYIKTKYNQDMKIYFEVEGYVNSCEICYKNGYYYVYPSAVKKLATSKILLYM